MATTTNFGWETPDDTDLVKDGALAMRTLGNAIDASMVDLKGGTTGQVLSKASNTDMDFTWVAQDDSNAIQNAIVDAKGDLIAASAADTPARLAVGNNGETLVADSSASTGLRWQGNFAAGKNKVINGDFSIWQRGTSFTGNNVFNADRFYQIWDGAGGTRTISQQTFTPGTAPVAGYESQYFLRFNQSVAGSGATYNVLGQKIEDVRTFAGQTVTFSFWAKANATVTLPSAPALIQNFGSGGSAETYPGFGASAPTLTTSWQRFSFTTTVPSISGKTVGTSSFLKLEILMPNNATFTIDTWGWQFEPGNTATAFQTATGTLQGELAACQRYYFRSAGTNAYSPYGLGVAYSTTAVAFQVKHPVTMRTTPTALEYSSNLGIGGFGAGIYTLTNLSLDQMTPDLSKLSATGASGLTQYRPYDLIANNNTSTFVALSAEL